MSHKQEAIRMTAVLFSGTMVIVGGMYAAAYVIVHFVTPALRWAAFMIATAL